MEAAGGEYAGERKSLTVGTSRKTAGIPHHILDRLSLQSCKSSWDVVRGARRHGHSLQPCALIHGSLKCLSVAGTSSTLEHMRARYSLFLTGPANQPHRTPVLSQELAVIWNSAVGILVQHFSWEFSNLN